ncbi:MAG: amidohydrolase family protein [Acidobacteria bacterium]|jgi:imidazolonepropionase-like amidohydrolase|nr:amidohydrolase family protein [Acidobacteriota bacterium]
MRMGMAGLLLLSLGSVAAAQDVALKGGTVLTITRGIVDNGTVLIQKGKITAVGKDVVIPAGVPVIDVTGRFIMPGLIDSHTHIAMDMSDINEATDPVTPQIWMKDIVVSDHDTIRTTLAGGVTTVKTMHGSANVIGGVNVVLKLKYGRLPEELIVSDGRPQLKMALGENPKRLHGDKGRSPSTRGGTAWVARKAFSEAREYKAKWDEYEKARASGKKEVKPPARDLRWETLKRVLEKKMTIDCHIYRADEIEWFLAFCREFDIVPMQISHCVDGYKVADLLARSGVTFGGWSDWWGFKEEAYDGNPFGFSILDEAGVNIAINSDSADEGRYLFLNAAKVQKYNDLSDDAVLRMITINPAKSLELDQRIGSLEVGKDGDVAVFDRHPLDSTCKCIMTIIEGEVFFDLAREGVSAPAQGGRQ